MGARTLLIGVAGGTGPDKTTVAQRLIAGLDPARVVLLPRDAYYRDRSHLPPEKRDGVGLDHPDAFEHDLPAARIAQVPALRESGT